VFFYILSSLRINKFLTLLIPQLQKFYLLVTNCHCQIITIFLFFDRERLTQIESKLNEVKAGRAPEYIQPLEELQVSFLCGSVTSAWVAFCLNLESPS
jgi:hypothetical protein